MRSRDREYRRGLYVVEDDRKPAPPSAQPPNPPPSSQGPDPLDRIADALEKIAENMRRPPN